MPLEAPPFLAPRVGTQLREPQVVFAPGETGGSLSVNPAFAVLFARLGLNRASAFLELPGEVVSGHADRHVVHVTLPGAPRAFYLKRQHLVGWKERLRNRFAGFGAVSRCEREADILQQLEACGLPAPRWVAFGAHRGRAFLLVEDVADAVELRRVLSDNALSVTARRALAVRLGEAVAAVHAAGFTTPDLTAKHVLVNRETLALTFLDWQSATRTAKVSEAARAEALGALHASLALATRAEHIRVLLSYRKASRGVYPHGQLPFAKTVGINPTARQGVRDKILRAAERHAKRRTVRDQLQPTANAQRLVWLAGETVCAISEVAAVWPRPAVAPPFYGDGPAGASRVRVAGRDAVLVRGQAFAPVGRVRAWMRAMPWRSPGVTAGRVLFHLARYGVPAPRLLAFGQKLTSATRAEWFTLYEAPTGVPLHAVPSEERCAVFASADECVRALHDAGCVLTGLDTAFTVCDGRVVVADPFAVRIVRRVSAFARRQNLSNVARLLGVE